MKSARKDIIAEAIKAFDAGLNCAEATFQAGARYAGIENPMIPRVATAFGAGLARMQQTCGLATGGLMAIGLVFGRDDAQGDKEKPYALGREFLEEFELLKKTMSCRDITGIDFKDPISSATYRAEGGVHYTVCGPLLKSTLLLLFNIIDRERSFPNE